MSGEGLIVPIVQTATRHHLAIESQDQAVASVEVIYNEHEYGRTIVLYVSPDLDDVAVKLEVRRP